MAGAFSVKAIPADGTRFATAFVAAARAQTKPSSGLFEKGYRLFANASPNLCR